MSDETTSRDHSEGNDRPVAAVILAAGQGTRMKSDKAKVLHEICGMPMVAHVLSALSEVSPEKTVVVVGHQAETVKERLSLDDVHHEGLEFALQAEQLGTGHAVQQAQPALEGFDGIIMVLTGDTPLLKKDTLAEFVKYHMGSGAAATVMSAEVDDATGYGRILRDEGGNLLGIVEHKDATEEQRKIGEYNSGLFCFDSDMLFKALDRVDRKNVQGEYYLTDVMGILRGDGLKVAVFRIADANEVIGINTLEQLAMAEKVMQEDKGDEKRER
jgi:bifunctional UDP-N-acetylglucosamine pyrophosphorylase/glucosamine-1-phosphate N-acetyltransferase